MLPDREALSMELVVAAKLLLQSNLRDMEHFPLLELAVAHEEIGAMLRRRAAKMPET